MTNPLIRKPIELKASAAVVDTSKVEVLEPAVLEPAVLGPEVKAIPPKELEDFTYTAGNINQLIMPNGTKILPVDGLYVATEEVVFDMLEHYAASGMYGVERLK